MLKTLFTALLCTAGLTFCLQQATAAQLPISETRPATKKKLSKKTASKAVAPVAEADETEPNIVGTTNTDFNCELGNKITIYHNTEDNQHIALRWKKRLHQLTRVDTTTGANRFENMKYGLIWIGIPAKSMLLDSKKGQQLANECKNAEQLKPVATDAPTAATASTS
jgi:hypothetical protein